MKLGQMFMYDLVQSKTANEDFDLFCLDDIVKGFNLNMKFNRLEHREFRLLSIMLKLLES